VPAKIHNSTYFTKFIDYNRIIWLNFYIMANNLNRGLYDLSPIANNNGFQYCRKMRDAIVLLSRAARARTENPERIKYE